jgi:hypothetical protein
LFVPAGAGSLTIVYSTPKECNMIRPTTTSLGRLALIAGLISFASFGHAGTGTVPPALAACSKALIDTLARAQTPPAYVVKPPSRLVSESVDPNAFTVYAKRRSTNELLAKASCKATPKGEILSFKALPVKS